MSSKNYKSIVAIFLIATLFSSLIIADFSSAGPKRHEVCRSDNIDYMTNLSDQEEFSALVFFGIKIKKLNGLTKNNDFFKYTEVIDENANKTTYCKQRFNKAKILGTVEEYFVEGERTTVIWEVNGRKNTFQRTALGQEIKGFFYDQQFSKKSDLRVHMDNATLVVDGQTLTVNEFAKDDYLQAILMHAFLELQKDREVRKDKAFVFNLINLTKDGQNLDLDFTSNQDKKGNKIDKSYDLGLVLPY